jgi:tetratricopeptide (TPR) repeat protein
MVSEQDQGAERHEVKAMRKLLLALFAITGFSGLVLAQDSDLAVCKSASSQQPKAGNKNYAAHIRDYIEKINIPACTRVIADKSAAREDRITALHRRANYYAYFSRYERARTDVNELMKLDPKRADTHILRASLFRRQKKPDDALTVLNKAVAALPNEHALYIERGRLHDAYRRFEEAEKDFSSALKAADRPQEQAEARMARGRIYTRTGKLDKAIEDYSAAIALDARPEELGFAYTNRAEAFLYLKERDKAAEDLKTMLSITAEDHPARMLANILMENIERSRREQQEKVDEKR